MLEVQINNNNQMRVRAAGNTESGGAEAGKNLQTKDQCRSECVL